MPPSVPRPQGPTPAPLRPLGDFGGLNTTAVTPDVPNAWQDSQERLAREQKATAGDYLGSMWRQDGLVDGLLANLAGRELMADPAYNPFTDQGTADLQRGLWPEYQNELYSARSSAHAHFLRGLLLQKQEDLTRLNDLGVKGNVARFALGAAMPDQLLLSMAGGWAARGATAYQAGRAMKLARDGTALARMEAAAGVAASQIKGSASKGAVALGVGLGAAENAAYERLRQSVNFEDDSSQVMEAALMGAAITSPFAIAGSRSAMRGVRMAERELETLRALRTVEQGGTLTPEQGKNLAEMHRAHRVVAELETGRITPEEADKALTELHGPQEPVERWMARYEAQLRNDTDAFIAENFPNRDGRATGQAAPSPAARADMDAAVDLETKTNFPEPVAASNAANPVLEGKLQGAFKLALKDRAKLRKAFDLEALDETTRAAKKAERDAAHAQAEVERQAQRRADEERMVNQHQLALAEQDPFHIPKAPEAPAVPVEPPKEASWVGRDVSWMDAEGSTVEGRITSWNQDIGKAIVLTPDGHKAVRLEHLDQYTGSAPEGFTADVGSSVGAMQVKGTQIESVASQRTAMSGVRIDYFAILNRSPLKSVRELAYKLIKDPIQNDRFEAQAMTASEWKSHYRRVVFGSFMADASKAHREAVLALKVPLAQRFKFREEFFREVTESTYDPTRLAGLNKDLLPHVSAASSALKKFYSTMLSEMKEAGVKGADQIAPDEFYTNRIWHHGNIRQAAEKFGDDAIIDLVASAIKDKKGVLERMRKAPGTEEVRDTLTNAVTHAGKSDAELLRLKASRFIRMVKALEFSPALREVSLAGRDMGTLRGQLRELGVDQAHIDDLVDLMFEVRPSDADAGRAANLKYRFQLDQSAQLETRDGVLRLSDLFETDARLLADSYVASLAGHIGLAKHGITSQADWQQALKKIEEEGSASMSTDGARIQKDIGHLQDIHKNITGRPMSEATFSLSNRAASTMRAYTRSVMLPQLGIAAAFEVGKSIATFGLTTMLKQMPSLRGFFTSLRQGYVPDSALSEQLRLMTGFGNEMASGYYRAAEIESGFFGQTLTRVEGTANALSHVSDTLSGNASFTSLTRQWSSKLAVQQFSDHAHGKKLSAKKTERWVGLGINADDLPDVMAAFKKHTTRNDKGSVEGIDYEAWHADSPRTYEQFQTFLTRQVRDAIQDHDLGETMPFMHGPLGKLFAELKTFFLVGHAKNFLKQLHFHDTTALQVWTIGFLAESLAYSTQTAINFPTELDTRLTPEKIAGAAFFRMSSMGTASLLAEFGYNVATGGDSLVSPGMTANTDIRSMWKTPSMVVASRVGSAFSTVGGELFGTDTTTSREARDLVGALPLMRLYGLNSAAQYWAAGFPSSDASKAFQP